MNKLIITTFLFLFSIISVFGQDEEPTKINEEKAKKEIVKAFETYKKGILSGDSKTAIAQLDKNSINYYQEVLDISLRADSAQINQLEVLDKLIVLSVKHKVPKEELIKMNGLQLLNYSIDNGLIGNKNTINEIEIGEVDINGEIAYGQFIVKKQKTPLYFGFTYDQSQWRLDITSVFEPTGFAIRKLVEMQNKSANEVIITMIESTTPGKKVSKDIWKPLL
ncbi:MAG TPA: hypothetical protein VIG94_03735 [Faecalibacter sp.]